jgi:hypothetical protein
VIDLAHEIAADAAPIDPSLPIVVLASLEEMAAHEALLDSIEKEWRLTTVWRAAALRSRKLPLPRGTPSSPRDGKLPSPLRGEGSGVRAWRKHPRSRQLTWQGRSARRRW